MRISTTTGPFIKHFSFEETIDMLADVGFEALDFSATAEEFCTDVHDKYYYEELKKRACDKGVIFNQAHAPHPSSYIDAEKNTERFKALVTSMKNASYLGVETIIVHPAQHLEFHIPGNPEILFEYNMEFYRKLIPYCEEYGIKIATENMWQYPGMISHSTCSRPDEFVRYVDGVSSKWLVACFDIGHSVLVREQSDEFIRKLGKDRLKCLHVHDVDGIDDSHTFPFMGIAHWDSIMKSLAEIGYTGDLTFEVGHPLVNIPKALVPHYARLLCETGKYLVSLYNNY